MKMRKLTLMLMLVGCSAVSVDANALSLGEADLDSYLDQPLKAVIPLLEVKSSNPQDISASLASREEFEKAGIEYSSVPTDLRFEVKLGATDTGTIRVFTNKPVRQPYVTFLLEVNWPSGRLVREYTLLMDPPVYAREQTPLVSIDPSSVSTEGKARIQSSTEAMKKLEDVPAAADAAAIPSTEVVAAVPKKHSPISIRHRVRSHEVLSKIAARMRTDHSVSIEQTMVAIQKYNPHAFIAGNIHLLKAGAILKAPSLKQIKAISLKQAKKSVADQTQAWRNRSNDAGHYAQKNTDLETVALEGTGRNLTPKEKPASVSSGRLELLSASDQTKVNKHANSLASRSVAAEDKLSVLEEQSDKSQLQLKDVQSRLQDVNDQLKTSEQLIQLKDDQLAALQNRLAGLEHPQLGSKGSADAQAVTTSSNDALPNTAQSAAVTLPAEPTSESVTPVAPVVQPPPAEDVIKQPLAVKSSGISWYADPWYWIAALGLGGVGAAIFAWRRRQAESEEEVFEADEGDFDGEEIEEVAAHVASQPVSTQEEPRQESVVSAVPVSAPPIAPVSAAPVSLDTPEAFTKEILLQVDTDLAHGRYQRALKALDQAIQRLPNEVEFRVKLLEVYAHTLDQSAFERQASELSALGDRELNVRILKLRQQLADELRSIGALSTSSAPAAPAAPVAPVAPVAPAPMEFTAPQQFKPEEKADLNFNLEDLDFGKEMEQMEASLMQPSTAPRELEALDFPELDDLVSEKPVKTEPPREAAKDWGMGLDDDLDFNAMDADEVGTKLDLARAYIDMDDKEGAREILGEVMAEGSADQQQQAKTLLAQLESL